MGMRVGQRAIYAPRAWLLSVIGCVPTGAPWVPPSDCLGTPSSQPSDCLGRSFGPSPRFFERSASPPQ